MSKKLKTVLICVVSVVVFLSSALLIYFCGKTHKDFYAVATEYTSLLGLKDGFVPQGLFKDATSEKFLTSGYMADGSASRIYVVEDNKYFTLTDNGTDYVGHCGGIATYKEYGYVVGEGKVYVFNIEDALLLDNGKSATILQVIEAPNGADFVYVHNDKLYLGEFYHEKKYPTAQSHHLTQNGVTNPALTFVYDLDNQYTYYFDIEKPDFAISTTEKIQGMCITDDNKIVLSQSWSLADSTLYVYKSLNEVGTTTTYNHNGKYINLYFLDNSSLVSTLNMPSMSEEVTFENGKVYVMFENACKKYKAVTRHKNTSIYAVDISELALIGD